MELLKELYKTFSPSSKEQMMRMFITSLVSNEEVYGKLVVTEDKGNIYITKGESPLYPTVVAHMDQVQSFELTDVIESNGMLFGINSEKKTFAGLGADDKNGIWIALKVLMTEPVLKIAFFKEEEIGCLGSNEADLNFFKDSCYILQPDRKGNSDIIFNAAGTILASANFKDKVSKIGEKYKYTSNTGMMTDVKTLVDRNVGVSCCNISCGYYNPHSTTEYTVFEDLNNAYSFIKDIIHTLGYTKYEYTKPVPKCTYKHGIIDWDAYDYGQSSSYKEPYYGKSLWFDQFNDLQDLMLEYPDFYTLDIKKVYDAYKTKFYMLEPRDYYLAYHDLFIYASDDTESK